jgi:hypothetical protein
MAFETHDRFTAKVLDVLRTEMQREETRQRLKCMVDPMVSHIFRTVVPYVTLALILFTLILVCQGYLVFKLWRMTPGD